MTKTEQIDDLLKSGKGYLFSKAVIDLGISKTYFAEYAKKNKLERVAQGIYISPGTWQDDLYILCLRNLKAVLSHETALQIHGLMEHEAGRIHVTVEYRYNATHLRVKDICVHQVKPEILSLGLSKGETVFGNSVVVYDKERTLCDIVKRRKEMDVQVFKYAIKEYIKCIDKNLGNLMRYASLLGIDEEMQKYTEVML
jgi:predicted transcriptional regulator of viral defense system